MKNLFNTSSKVLFSFCVMLLFTKATAQRSELNPNLLLYCQTLESEFNQISEERKLDLIEISNFIFEQQSNHKKINLLFVCTSNSRRSHMAQVWSQVASYYYNIKDVATFSGGTEQTRVNKNAISTLKKVGIPLESNQQSDNPIWTATIGENFPPLVLFSKVYTDATNPNTNFGAIMVCSEANESCPNVPGADFRMGLPYQDPKISDNTPQQTEKYDERCRQIAREMFFVFSQIK